MTAVSSAEIGMVIQSNQEIKGELAETNKLMRTLTEVSIRNEERQANSSEALERLGGRLEKYEDKLSTLWDMVHKNSLIVNGALILASSVVGGGITYYFWG